MRSSCKAKAILRPWSGAKNYGSFFVLPFVAERKPKPDPARRVTAGCARTPNRKFQVFFHESCRGEGGVSSRGSHLGPSIRSWVSDLPDSGRSETNFRFDFCRFSKEWLQGSLAMHQQIDSAIPSHTFAECLGLEVSPWPPIL